MSGTSGIIFGISIIMVLGILFFTVSKNRNGNDDR
jgi:hypothetical protein